VKTGDGYTFKLTADGTWSDGDMTFDSVEQMMEENDVVIGDDSDVEPTQAAARRPRS